MNTWLIKKQFGWRQIEIWWKDAASSGVAPAIKILRIKW